MLRQHFLSWSVSHATLGDIGYYLTLFRDRLGLFLYSGHAGRDVLLTEDGASRSGGIAHLLGQCKNLKVVILNGCSTAGAPGRRAAGDLHQRAESKSLLPLYTVLSERFPPLAAYSHSASEGRR